MDNEEQNQDYLLGDAIKEYTQDYLHQTFLVDCLLKVSRKIVENERSVKEALEDADSFISAEAWIDCAKDAIKAFDPFCRKPE